MPPSNANDQSDTAAASGDRVDVNASNRRATVVTQSQTNFTLSPNSSDEEENAVGAVLGDDLSHHSSNDDTVDDLMRLGRRVNLEDNTPPSAVEFDNLPILQQAESTERNNIRSPTSSLPTFAEENASYIPPTMEAFPPTPPFVDTAVRAMLLHVWGIEFARDYQIDAIFFLVFLKVGMMYLIRKTGEGKSLVLLGMATALRGITIDMVPLLGLGCDQVSKSKCINKRFEAYHVDEFRDKDYEKLIRRLKTYRPSDKTSILIIISPQELNPSSRWYKLFVTLAVRGFISAFCVDEAHSTVENYDSFRPEFKQGISSMNNLIAISKINNPAHSIPTYAVYHSGL